MLKFLVLAVCLQAFPSVTECFLEGFYKREIVIDTGTHIKVCKQAPLEIGIVLDSSSSIHPRDFQTAKAFLEDYLKHFDIGSGQEGVRVSIITYGKGIYPEDGFDLTTYNTLEEVLAAVRRIPHRAGLYTDTGKAIQYMHEVQLAKGVVRPWAEKISVVITDGNSQQWRLTKKAAEEARNDGIIIFAIGVGEGVRDEELLNIAGDQSRVTKVKNYDQLDSIKEILARKTCIEKEKPTTTPPPKTQKCGEINPTDVYFAFSPAELGVEATAWATSFISNTISGKDLDVGFRFGVVSGSCPDDEGFDLDDYSTVEEYRNRLRQYETSKLSLLSERLLGGAYGVERGGRVGAGKVAVIITNGYGLEDEDLSAHVFRLKENGVTVIIADASGEGVDVYGAVVLTGRSSRLQSETLVSLLCPQ
ncbi:unnamed protein product [Candidula unifasciata]|uniref:VWFA domain-containing protein n=1 Tax=Candidula unifasciata TaxID=100452 RepID=A0A8S4A534_9EUPU|nr:unnamed protein product [Candidula unifasciata]